MSASGALSTMALWCAFGLQHSWLAQKSTRDRIALLVGTPVTRRCYPFAYFFVQCLAYPLIAFAAFRIGSGKIIWQVPAQFYPLHFCIKLVGHFFVIFSFLATDINRFTGLKQLFGAADKLQSNQRLSLEFPYSWVRHPLYLGIVLTFLGSVSIYSERTLLNFACLVLYIYWGSTWEERQLVRDFGNGYRDYQLAVPRFIPTFSLNFHRVVRRIGIRLVLPVVWGLSRKRTAVALNKFAITEADGAWQDIYAIGQVSDPRLKAKLFQHAIEESHHSALFEAASWNYSDVLQPRNCSERISLFKGSDPATALRSFYAYECVGENDVCEEFSAYASAAPYTDLKEIFERLRGDEEAHAAYTRKVYEEILPSAGKRWWGMLLARSQRVYQAWLRFSEGMGSLPSTVLLSATYYLLGFLVRPSTQANPELAFDRERRPQ